MTAKERENIIAEIKALVSTLTHEERLQLLAWVEAKQKARGGGEA